MIGLPLDQVPDAVAEFIEAGAMVIAVGIAIALNRVDSDG